MQTKCFELARVTSRGIRHYGMVSWNIALAVVQSLVQPTSFVPEKIIVVFCARLARTSKAPRTVADTATRTNSKLLRMANWSEPVQKWVGNCRTRHRSRPESFQAQVSLTCLDVFNNSTGCNMCCIILPSSHFMAAMKQSIVFCHYATCFEKNTFSTEDQPARRAPWFTLRAPCTTLNLQSSEIVSPTNQLRGHMSCRVDSCQTSAIQNDAVVPKNYSTRQHAIRKQCLTGPSRQAPKIFR